jgi:hypothetical protein
MNIERKQQIIQLRDKGYSIPEICELLGVKKGTVGYHLKNYEGISKGKRIIQDSKYNHIKKEFGDEICKSYPSNSIAFISKKYNVSQFFIKNFLMEKGIYKKKNRKLDIGSLLCGDVTYENPYYSSINGNIKKYLLDNNLVEYKCNICSLNKWNEKHLTLDLDHIDGNRNNNILSNLRLVCPNCHSQTDTYKNKLR